MLIYDSVETVKKSFFKIGDVILLLGEDQIGDRMPRNGIAIPDSEITGNHIINTANPKVNIELMPTPAGGIDPTTAAAEVVHAYHTEPAQPWRSNETITIYTSKRSYNNKEYLPRLVPFTTGATFADDQGKWIEVNTVTSVNGKSGDVTLNARDVGTYQANEIDTKLDFKADKIDTYTKAEIREMIKNIAGYFPVGHIIITLNTLNPSSYGYQGTWELIESETTLFTTASTEALGTIEGTNTPDVPLQAHSHSRGSMEITGSPGQTIAGTQSGAFFGGPSGGGVEGGYYPVHGVDFAASRTWTGRTSTEGSTAEDFNVKGKHLSVYMWKRTA